MVRERERERGHTVEESVTVKTKLVRERLEALNERGEGDGAEVFFEGEICEPCSEIVGVTNSNQLD